MDEDSALDKVDNGYAAAESEDGLVFKTIPQSPMTNRTGRKSRKVTIPNTFMSFDSEDELPRTQPRKHIHASPVPPSVGGHTKYFRQNSNQFPNKASKKLTPAREALAATEGSDQLKPARQETTRHWRQH